MSILARISLGIVSALIGAAGTAILMGSSLGIANPFADGGFAGLDRIQPAAAASSSTPVHAPAGILVQAANDAPAPVAPPGQGTVTQEDDGDWRIICAPPRGHDAAQGGERKCSMSQQQFDSKSQQRVLAVELTARPDGLDGILVLPFGLDLDRGVALQTDDGPVAANLRFRTCLPAGCLVLLAFDRTQIGALEKASALNIKATADGAGDALFRVSLKGFADAEGRLTALLH